MDLKSTRFVLGVAAVVSIVLLLVLASQQGRYEGPMAPDGTPFQGPTDAPPGADLSTTTTDRSASLREVISGPNPVSRPVLE